MRELEEHDLRESYLKDDQGCLLYLFLLDGRPVTDGKGGVLLNIAGKPVLSLPSYKRGRYQDVKGFPLRDCRGKRYGEPGFNPAAVPDAAQRTSTKRKVLVNGQVFALDGHPLTDLDGEPLVDIKGKTLLMFNPKGLPVSDSDEKEVTDKLGRVLNSKCRPFRSLEKIPLRVFDNDGRPVTDEYGFPFTNILGQSVIVVDEFGKPTTTMNGFPTKDADAMLPWENDFDLRKEPKYNKINKAIICKNKEHGIAFDCYGHPLTDMSGFPLFDLEGIVLVRKKKIWIDVNETPAVIIYKSVFDRDAIAKLSNTKGTPVQLYDRRGYPLVDHEGTPLTSATGEVLIKFSESGEPVSDLNGFPIFDSRGNDIYSASFRPCRNLKCNRFLEEALKMRVHGVQFFDVAGMPVTNRYGIPLLNIYQEPIADFDGNGVPLRDARGRTIYNSVGLPIVRSFERPLLAPNGVPLRIYSKSRRPLTDKRGNVLKSVAGEYLIKLSNIGQLVKDYKGEPLYDTYGCPMNRLEEFKPTMFPQIEMYGNALSTLDGEPLILYDSCGEPLSDSSGSILIDGTGKPLLNSSEECVLTDTSGHPTFDIHGHSDHRIVGRTSPHKTAIYDENDRPLIGPSGFILRARNGEELVIFDRYGYPIATSEGKAIFDYKVRPIFTTQSDISKVPVYEKKLVYGGRIQLFDCDDRPLLDVTGTLLFSSKGIPLIQLDITGKPTSDFLGRPVYDKNGIPVSNPGGVWRHQKGVPYRLYDSKGWPLTDSRGKELRDLDGQALLERDQYGHPVRDRSGGIITDANGHLVTDSNFNGISEPPQSRTSALLDPRGLPLLIFDLTGRPLTDECGKPLETCKGRPLIDVTRGLDRIVDMLGRTVYDINRMPLGCHISAPILTMSGEPLVLFDKNGNPLMTVEGVPIKCFDGARLLVLDGFGRPSSSLKGSALYGRGGYTVSNRDCDLSADISPKISLVSFDGRPVRVFNFSGLPLTDEKGNFLFRADGKPLCAGSWGDNPG